MSDFKALCIASTIVFAIIIAAISLAIVFNKITCDNLQAVSGKSTAFYIFGGCMIETESGKIPIENYMYIGN